MSQSLLLPAFISLFGVAAALFMVGFAASGRSAHPTAPASGPKPSR
ncbi:putative membrane protein [Mycobacterium xenopi 3993]|nr:putative membrane protein [Mycobacterium xenopi 3993]